MAAKLIAIEGLDGAGKETQTTLLKKALEAKGLKVARRSFPRYGEASSRFAEYYLRGEFGDYASDVNAYAASSFFAIDRDVGSPVFFKQSRLGKNNKPFNLYKFRSMTNETDDAGNLLPAAERTTKVGQIIRKYSLDELSNFWFIIKGDIPLRILKTRRGFSVKMLGAFALPARLARTRIAASLQAEPCSPLLWGCRKSFSIILSPGMARCGKFLQNAFPASISPIATSVGLPRAADHRFRRIGMMGRFALHRSGAKQTPLFTGSISKAVRRNGGGECRRGIA